MKLLKLIFITSVACAPLVGLAQQAPAPNYFVANCFNCHGTEGRGQTAIPPLAGLSATYIVEQMSAFKSGARPATVMHQLAKGYTDEEIARAAAYFAAVKK